MRPVMAHPTRRQLLRHSAVLLAGTAATNLRLAAAEPAEAPPTPPLPQTLTPYLQNPTPDGMTVCFLAREITAVSVAWWQGETGAPTVTPAAATPIPNTPWTRWTVRLDGLAPGATYRYQVRHRLAGAETTTGPFNFTTIDPKAKGVRLAVFNDIHDRRETITALMGHVTPADYDFVIFNGDMFNDPSAADGARRVFELWDFYIRLLDGQRKPILFVRGNHETRGSFREHLRLLFVPPLLTLDQAPADQQWQFELTAGPVHFIFMDTGEDDGPETPVDSYKRPRFWQSYRTRQAAWLRDRVAANAGAGRPWRVFVSHIPLHNPAGWFSLGSRDGWAPSLTRAGVSLMLAGHDHAWKLLPAGKTFAVQGKPGVKDTPACPVLIGGGPSLREGTVILLSADARQLRARLLDANGKTLHDFTSTQPLAPER